MILALLWNFNYIMHLLKYWFWTLNELLEKHFMGWEMKLKWVIYLSAIKITFNRETHKKKWKPYPAVSFTGKHRWLFLCTDHLQWLNNAIAMLTRQWFKRKMHGWDMPHGRLLHAVSSVWKPTWWFVVPRWTSALILFQASAFCQDQQSIARMHERRRERTGKTRER